MTPQNIVDGIIGRAQQGTRTANVTTGHAVKPLYIIFYGYDEGDVEGFLGRDGCIKRSMHLLVDRSGKAHQLAPFTTKTWHAGQSYWQGHHGLNSYGIGIALMRPYVETQFTWLDWAVPEIVMHYNIRDIVGHADVSPNRQDDPGPAFPMDRYKPYVEYGNAESAGKYTVVPSALNVRGGPGVHYSVIATLEAGSTIKVLRASSQAPDWLFVAFDTKQGWVHESFVRRA